MGEPGAGTLYDHICICKLTFCQTLKVILTTVFPVAIAIDVIRFHPDLEKVEQMLNASHQ
jgi:hypothetical protein